MAVQGPKYRGREHRRAERRRLGRPATLDIGKDAPLQPCIISDISATGAKLIVVTAASVPDQFDLLLAGRNGPRRISQVAWRSGTMLGVRFIAGPEA